jgi:hypothetical protein
MFKTVSYRLLTLFVALFCFNSQSFAVWQQPPTEFDGALAMSSDAGGNAIALVSTFDGISTTTISFYNYLNLTWTLTAQFTTPGIVDSADISMDPSGAAIAAWASFDTENGGTAFFNGTSWLTPVNNPLAINANFPLVSLNNLGLGALIWLDSDTNIMTSFFSPVTLTWSTPTNLGPGVIPSGIAYSQNGTAVAAWDNSNVTVANFIGGAWQTPIILSSSGFPSGIGIDNAGNALVIWFQGGNLFASTFNAAISMWLSPVTLALSVNSASLSMSPNGTAVAVWETSTNLGMSSSYNGTTWAAPLQFSDDVDTISGPSVDVNSFGNALVIWASSVPVIKSSRLPLGGVWQPEEILQSNPPFPDVRDIISSLSDNGIGFATWRVVTEGPNIGFADATLTPLPPSNLNVVVCKDRSATRTACVNTITFTASPDPTVIAYYLFRNGVLIAAIPATGPLTVVEQVCCGQANVYTLVAVDGNGTFSSAITTTVQN